MKKLLVEDWTELEVISQMVGEVEAPDALALHLLGVDDHLEQAAPLSLFAHTHNSISFKEDSLTRLDFRKIRSEVLLRIFDAGTKIFKNHPELLIVL